MTDIPPDIDGDGTPDERRGSIGRRQSDVARSQVREEIRRLRLRWLALWLLTLAFSSLAWYRAEDNGKESEQAVKASRARVSRVFCEAINGNAAASNAQTDFLRRLLIEQTRASRAFDDVYRQLGLPAYSERLRQARETATALEDRKVPVLPCEEFADAVRRNSEVLPSPTPPPKVDVEKIQVPGAK